MPTLSSLLALWYVCAASPFVLDKSSIETLSPGQMWIAEKDGARALFEDRALVIGLQGSSFEVTASGLRFVSGQALLVVGDRGVTVDTGAGPTELRGEIVYLPRDAITAEQKRALEEALDSSTRRAVVLVPRDVEEPVPWTQSALRQGSFEGLDVEALEIEAGCVEICLE